MGGEDDITAPRATLFMEIPNQLAVFFDHIKVEAAMRGLLHVPREYETNLTKNPKSGSAITTDLMKMQDEIVK